MSGEPIATYPKTELPRTGLKDDNRIAVSAMRKIIEEAKVKPTTKEASKCPPPPASN